MNLADKIKDLKAAKNTCQLTIKEVDKQLAVYEGLENEISLTEQFLRETDAKYEWDYVCDKMSPSSREDTPFKVFEGAYLLGDGFGQMSKASASEQCYDWSHIRDSSPEAKKKIYDYLNAKLEAL